MRHTILILIAAMTLTPVVLAQSTITHPWNEQILQNRSGTPNYLNAGQFVAGYDFLVKPGMVVPEVVELGCALPIGVDRASLLAAVATSHPNWTVTGGTAKVALWEMNSTYSGTQIALVDVPIIKTDLYTSPATPNWSWVTLPQPIVLTPGKHYRIVVQTGVTFDVWDASSNLVFSQTYNEMYWLNQAQIQMAMPGGPISFQDIVLEDGGTWPGTASINTLPGVANYGPSWAAPMGIADIGWREAQVAPTLNAPTTGTDAPAVLITEVGPDVVPAGHEGGELQNLSSRWQDLSGWRICVWDSLEASSLAQSAYDPVAIGTLPQGTTLAPGQTLTFGETAGGSSFNFAFGAWSWGATSKSAVALLDANDNIIDVVCVNNLALASISNPVSGLAAFWTTSYLGQWNTANTWQRQGNADTDGSSDWTRGNGQNLGTQNSVLSTPFAKAGDIYANVGGSDPAYSGQLSVGDKLDVAFVGNDVNVSDTLALSVTWASGLTPAQAGFSGITTNQPMTTSGTGPVTLNLTGTALAAGTITFHIDILDSTSRSAGITYTLTIAPEPNFTPVFSVSYDIGSGRQTINSGANFGTTATPIPFGMPLSTYGFSFSVNDGNGDSVGVSATLGSNPNSAQVGLAPADFEHAAQTAPYTWTPNGSALFAHLNNVDTAFTLTLTADDGNNGTRQFVITFLVEDRPANAAPSITVTSNGNNVANNGLLVVAPGTTLASLGLQITVNDANLNDIQLSASISNLTTQGLLVSEFESVGFVTVPYSLSPSAGVFNAPATTHHVDLTADDGIWLGTTTFGFDFVVNRAPTLQVTSNNVVVAPGSTLGVNYLDSLASLGLSISVDDPDGTPTAVSASVSGVTTQGFTSADFSAAQQAVSYSVNPANGTFNDPTGSSHQISLTATDQYGGQATFDFNIDANPFAPLIEVKEGGAVIANAAPASGGRQFGTQDIGSGATSVAVIEIGNTGSGPLDVNSVVLGGPNAGDFILNANSLPTQIFPGGLYTFDIAFDPAMNGLKQATVTISYVSAGTNATWIFAVEGAGYDPNGVVIGSSNMPTAVAGRAYGPVQLQAVGGTGNETWSVFSGQLPAGLTLTPQGVISGMPTVDPSNGIFAGTFTFIVRATDAQGGTDEQTLSIEVLASPRGDGGGGSAGCDVGTGSGTALLALLALFGLALVRRRKA